jgi:hypothetical protein
MGDLPDDIEDKAEGSQTGDGELEAVHQGGPTEAGGPTHDEADLKEDGGA